MVSSTASKVSKAQNGQGSKPENVVALLIVDMISCWDFPDAEKLLPGAVAIAPRIAALAARCRRNSVPVIYANDNLGHWRSDFVKLVDESLACGGEAAAITTALQPEPEDYFVLKPKHSAFFATPLTLLLQDLEVRHIVVTGVSSDQCVLTTVGEARMREYDVTVPRDCVASQTAARNAVALRQFDEVFKVRTTPATRLVLPAARDRGARA